MRDVELHGLFRELLNYVGKRTGDIEKKISELESRLDLPRPLELPSPRIPIFVGAVGALIFGALIFAAGMWTVWFLGAPR